MALREGAGGYGGITSMNMDQRESPYYPHNPLLKYRNYKLNKMVVKCLSCHEEWEHDLGNPWSSGPEKCIKEKQRRLKDSENAWDGHIKEALDEQT